MMSYQTVTPCVIITGSISGGRRAAGDLSDRLEREVEGKERRLCRTRSVVCLRQALLI